MTLCFVEVFSEPLEFTEQNIARDRRRCRCNNHDRCDGIRCGCREGRCWSRCREFNRDFRCWMHDCEVEYQGLRCYNHDDCCYFSREGFLSENERKRCEFQCNSNPRF